LGSLTLDDRRSGQRETNRREREEQLRGIKPPKAGFSLRRQ
jgi:hypothetical protein